MPVTLSSFFASIRNLPSAWMHFYNPQGYGAEMNVRQAVEILHDEGAVLPPRYRFQTNFEYSSFVFQHKGLWQETRVTLRNCNLDDLIVIHLEERLNKETLQLGMCEVHTLKIKCDGPEALAATINKRLQELGYTAPQRTSHAPSLQPV